MGGQVPETFSAVIIDGYNLINRVPELASRLAASGLEASRSYLLGWLRRYQTARHRRVVLVLDGPNPRRSDFGPVEVFYHPTADDAVVKAAAPGTLVVTSDQAVASGARIAGATVLSSEDFWRAMTANASPRRARAGDEGGGPGPGRAGGLRGPGGRPRKLTKREKRRRRQHDELLRKV